jgi:hypothetical protein
VLRSPLVPDVEHQEEDPAASVAVAEEHPEDEADLLDVVVRAEALVEAASAVEVAAAVSQEVDAVVVVVSVADVDEEATKCFDLGRLQSHSEAIGDAQSTACRPKSDLRLPTDTMIIWRRFGVARGFSSACRKNMAPCCGHFETGSRVRFFPAELLSSSITRAHK